MPLQCRRGGGAWVRWSPGRCGSPAACSGPPFPCVPSALSSGAALRCPASREFEWLLLQDLIIN